MVLLTFFPFFYLKKKSPTLQILWVQGLENAAGPRCPIRLIDWGSCLPPAHAQTPRVRSFPCTGDIVSSGHHASLGLPLRTPSLVG